jgi:Ca2+/Na+ antiporter
MTVISLLYTKILLTVPAFSFLYFMLSWVFIFLFGVFLIYHAAYKNMYQSSNLAGYQNLSHDDEDEKDEDLQTFIKSFT